MFLFKTYEQKRQPLPVKSFFVPKKKHQLTAVVRIQHPGSYKESVTELPETAHTSRSTHFNYHLSQGSFSLFVGKMMNVKEC